MMMNEVVQDQQLSIAKILITFTDKEESGMRKKYIVFTMLAGIISTVLVGCSSQKEVISGNPPSQESSVTEMDTMKEVEIDETEETDLTVELNCVDYTQSQLNNTILVAADCSFAYGVPSLDALTTHCESAINCTVDDIRYTVLEGTPYTVYDVVINDVYIGDLNIGDRISLVQYGGYMTVQDEIDYYKDDVRFSKMTDEEKSTTLIEKRSTTAADLSIGDNFVTFIAKESLIENAYYTLNEGESVFLFQDDETLIRYTQNYKQNELLLNDLIALKKN